MDKIVVHVAKADRRGDNETQPTEIHIDETLPDLKTNPDNWRKQYKDFYHNQANIVADALQNSLPGGTLDELIAELLSRRAVLFRVTTYG